MLEISQGQKEEYIESGARSCLVCASWEVVFDVLRQHTGTIVMRKAACDDCNASWTEYYLLHDVKARG